MLKRENVKIQIPEKANMVVKTLEEAGFEAYVVGGCVRDSILGRMPNDWDITTSAKPEEVKSLFRRTVDTGLQHGTITVMVGDEGFEVTTYRIDGEYEDGRHPKEVIFTPNLEEDLLRRDFTINAMAYSDQAGLVDLYGGLEDIENKRICCVGNPMDRFGEDALRMMRAVRFSAQLGYEIEENTRQAIRVLAPNLQKVSAERIQVELVKLITSDHPEHIRLLWEDGLSRIFFPEWDAAMVTPQKHLHHCYDVGEHIIHSMMAVEPEKDLRLAMMLHDIGKPETMTTDSDGTTHFYNHPLVGEKMAQEILRRLKFDNHTIDVVSALVRYHDYGNGMELDEKVCRRAIHRMGEEIFEKYLKVKRADIMAQSTYQREEKLASVQSWGQMFAYIMENRQCVSLKTLEVKGADLIQMGVKPGPAMGELLNWLLDRVLDDPTLNRKDILLELAAGHSDK